MQLPSDGKILGENQSAPTFYLSRNVRLHRDVVPSNRVGGLVLLTATGTFRGLL